MKLHEQFEVAQPVSSVWSFFEQPDQVAGCIPGVEEVTVLGENDLEAKLTQNVGPMSATFDGTVRIVERIPHERISLTATGKSIRGASGNARATVDVSLTRADPGTRVEVEADVALAGALGSVGQKVVAKQAGKVIATFSRNLEEALGGGPAPEKGAAPTSPALPELSSASHPAPADSMDPGSRRWAQLAAALSGASLAASVMTLLYLRRGGR